MIIAYAQAADRQGIDAAANGLAVAPDEPIFAALRERAITLNFTTTPHQVGEVEVRYGRGLVRLELKGTDGGQFRSSPIVVVVDAADLGDGGVTAARLAIETVSAIGRQCDVGIIEAGFVLGERQHRSIRTKRRVVSAVSMALIVVTIAWVARSCASADDIIGSAHSWSR